MHRVIQNIYMVPLLLSMLAGFRSFKRQWPAPYKTFSLLLTAIFIVEVMAISWKYYFFKFGPGPHSPNNMWLYDRFLIPQYLLYMAVYYQVIGSKRIKRLILLLAVVYTAFSLINLYYIQGILDPDTWTFGLGGAILLFLTIAWFTELRQERPDIRPERQPMFWISIGAFVFHTADLPYLLSMNYLIHNNLHLALTFLNILIGLNCLMYSLYTIAFLCPPPPTKL